MRPVIRGVLYCCGFLPEEYPDHVMVKLDEEQAAPKPGKKDAKLLDLAAWLLAWDRLSCAGLRKLTLR